MVIIQPSTSKIVLVTDERERWFLPKGRKDKGETLEQTALREAYEEVNDPPPSPSFYTLIRPPSRVLMSKLTSHTPCFFSSLTFFDPIGVRVMLRVGFADMFWIIEWISDPVSAFVYG